MKDIFYKIVVLSIYIAAMTAFIVALTRFEIIESGVFFIVGQLWIIIATLKENHTTCNCRSINDDYNKNEEPLLMFRQPEKDEDEE